MSREVILAARPQGEPKPSDFELRELRLPALGDGDVAVRNVFVSVDPYMRSRMTGQRTYVGPYDVGGSIDGGAVGRVTASRDARFVEGDWVSSQLGWAEEGVVAGDGLRKLDPDAAPPSTALGILGLTGFTAWIGLVYIGRVKQGETIYVSGAAGAVGSAVVQIAKLKGLHAIGSSGTDEKVEWVRSLGVEAFNYHDTPVREALAGGIDVYFDNVGGDQLEAALGALRPFGRVVACGAISRYNDEGPVPGPRNLGLVVTKRLRVEGFIVSDHVKRFGEFMGEVAPRVGDGQILWRETILDGIENIPAAFAGLFHGENLGKMLVRVGPDD